MPAIRVAPPWAPARRKQHEKDRLLCPARWPPSPTSPASHPAACPCTPMFCTRYTVPLVSARHERCRSAVAAVEKSRSEVRCRPLLALGLEPLLGDALFQDAGHLLGLHAQLAPYLLVPKSLPILFPDPYH